MTAPTAPRLQVFERGWLSSNNVLLHDEAGATLVDTGHVNHAVQTVALVEHALQGAPLTRIVNTHLHSDHCGGNAALQRAWAVHTLVPQGDEQAARRWDEASLTYLPTGQRCARFAVDGALRPGDTLHAGGRAWQALAAPGHDPHSLMLFEAQEGVLISADALWEHGFGVVFPELEGGEAFDEVEATLDLIASLPVSRVIPGHGAPFSEVGAALARARDRLGGFRADPARHARHAGKVLLMYHLMEVAGEPPASLDAWLEATPLMPLIHARSGQAGSAAAWFRGLLAQLIEQGAIGIEHGRLVPR